MTTPLRIAVADDEVDMRDFLKRALERLGHVVLGPVEDGQHLVELSLANRPDLVITDIRMPRMDGDEALRQILAVHPVPCIIVSAFGESDAWHVADGSTTWEILDKPFRLRDLQEAICQLMRRMSPAKRDCIERPRTSE